MLNAQYFKDDLSYSVPVIKLKSTIPPAIDCHPKLTKLMQCDFFCPRDGGGSGNVFAY